jgi:hypothetical protein
MHPLDLRTIAYTFPLIYGAGWYNGARHLMDWDGAEHNSRSARPRAIRLIRLDKRLGSTATPQSEMFRNSLAISSL